MKDNPPSAKAQSASVERLTPAVTMMPGDCFAKLKTLEDNSVDSCVTDPPYHLISIVKRFGSDTAAPAKVGKTGAYGRASTGFMGKKWDGGDIAFRSEIWAEVLRVLKPGGHLVAFGGTRTYHRMACAIEDAGFEIRDSIQWLYGSGFPKSHDVSKGIDRIHGAKREPMASGKPIKRMIPGADQNKDGWEKNNGRVYVPGKSEPASEPASEWEDWGTALKPACEPIVLARKPLSEKTVAANVLRWGTGAINIDGCRVATEENLNGGGYAQEAHARHDGNENYRMRNGQAGEFKQPIGRWPANVIHDGSDEVVGAFPETQSGALNQASVKADNQIYGQHNGYPNPKLYAPDSGSAARFYYAAKADADDRLGSKHPTVKPVDLIQYLIRLVTPPRGLVLDPFAGTGTLGEACIREGFRAILIEREAEYCEDIRRRMKLTMSGPDERIRESIKAKNKDKPIDYGPLFSPKET